MIRHHRYSLLTTVGVMVGAALLGAGLASAAGGDAKTSDVTSILSLYRAGAGGLGIPALFVTGTPPERSIGVGDANHDGYADLAVRQDETDTIRILQGNGAGGFGGPTILPASVRQKIVALGDFNEDGLDDQAVAESFAAGARLTLIPAVVGQQDPDLHIHDHRQRLGDRQRAMKAHWARNEDMIPDSTRAGCSQEGGYLT